MKGKERERFAGRVEAIKLVKGKRLWDRFDYQFFA